MKIVIFEKGDIISSLRLLVLFTILKVTNEMNTVSYYYGKFNVFNETPLPLPTDNSLEIIS